MEDQNLAAELRETKAHLKHTDEMLRMKTEELDRLRVLLNQREGELIRTRDDLNNVTLQLGVSRERLRHAERAVITRTRADTKRNRISKLHAFLASLLFLLASVLASFGTNMLTTNPPNNIGWIMIVLAAFAYVIAALMTTFLVIEGNR